MSKGTLCSLCTLQRLMLSRPTAVRAQRDSSNHPSFRGSCRGGDRWVLLCPPCRQLQMSLGCRGQSQASRVYSPQMPQSSVLLTLNGKMLNHPSSCSSHLPIPSGPLILSHTFFFFPQILTCRATPPAMHPLHAPHHFVPSSNCPNHFSYRTGIREGSVLLSNCFENRSRTSVRD